MNATQKLICTLAGGAALALAAPVFADSGRDRGHDYSRDRGSYGNYEHGRYRDHNRGYDRRRLLVVPRPIHDPRHFVVVRRPILVERPVYYAEPAPMPMAYNIGPAAIIGAVIGGYIDHHR